MDNEIRLAVRTYLGKRRLSERRMASTESQLEQLLPELGVEHATAMSAGEIDMIEIEFVDEPDPLARYFRWGTNPAGMVQPVAIRPRKGRVEKRKL
jgi:hypothetical protein